MARVIPRSSILDPPSSRTDGGPRNRSGISLLEMIVSMILLGAVMAIVVPALGWMGVHNRLALQKQEAAEGLHNLMEDLTARPFAELTPERAEQIKLPTELQHQLPGSKLQVEIAEADPGAKRIRLQLMWNQHNGRPLAPMRLTAWVHNPEGDQ